MSSLEPIFGILGRRVGEIILLLERRGIIQFNRQKFREWLKEVA